MTRVRFVSGGGGGGLRAEEIEAVVLDAAREYFNASTSHEDPQMSLAASCLALVEQRSGSLAVQAEARLVKSVVFLSRKFGLNVLPLTLRLASNRSDFVRRAMESVDRGHTRVHDVSPPAWVRTKQQAIEFTPLSEASKVYQDDRALQSRLGFPSLHRVRIKSFPQY